MLYDELMHDCLGYRDKAGYWHAKVSNVETRETYHYAVHSLIARWLYRSPWPRGAHVHHRDGIKDNNHWSNLIFPLLQEEHTLLSGKQIRKCSVGSPYWRLAKPLPDVHFYSTRG